MKWMKKYTQLSPRFWTALRGRERKRERSQSRETVQGERNREIARENRRIVATRDCTTNSYPEEHGTVKISSHFSPKTAGKFVRKNQTDRERIVAGKRELRDFCCQGDSCGFVWVRWGRKTRV